MVRIARVRKRCPWMAESERDLMVDAVRRRVEFSLSQED